MTYLLDSGVPLAYLKGRTAIEHLVQPWITRAEPATSIVVCGEVLECAKGASNYAARRTELLAAVQSIPALTLSWRTVERYADV